MGGEMSAIRLLERRVEKPWGRRALPPMFGSAQGGAEPIGEIWFELPDNRDAELLVKYLFTSEKLSVQVHPDDRAARRQGYKRGKDEAWVILDAEPGATIGLGVIEQTTKYALREASLNGSIEALIRWKPVTPGEVIYSPAGTVHALGPGLSLIEIQQNLDLTYRLYDYGRARELHLPEGIAAATPYPYVAPILPPSRNDGRQILAAGGAFVLERWFGALSKDLRTNHLAPLWIVPMKGNGVIGRHELLPGSVWLVDQETQLELAADAELLLAYSGSTVREELTG
jgi:mannose-6-phosphate isomerase